MKSTDAELLLHIEKLRKELINAKENNLEEVEIIKLSQRLDRLIIVAMKQSIEKSR